MNLWKELKQVELTRLQKILLGLFVISLVILVPESAFLLDVGGIDLILFMLFMYSQNIKVWFDTYFGTIKYPLIEPKTYVKSVSLSSALFFITSSFVFSSGFFLLLMFLKKG